MEHKFQDSSKVDSAEALPSLIDVMTLNAIVGFDSIEMNRISNNHSQLTSSQPASPLTKGTEAAVTQSSSEECQPIRHQRTHSISMPSSPLTSHLENTKRVTFSGAVDGLSDLSATTNSSGNGQPKPPKFHSQPISQGSAYTEAATNRLFSSHAEQQPRNPNIDRLKDRRFDSFKTWSGKLERQLSHLRGKPRETEQEDSGPDADIETLPVDRYFDALEGPELETLRDSEELVLPEDKKWPFLLRYPISSFGICLGVSSQAILWKTLATSPSTSFLHVSLDVNLILWCIAVALVAIVSFVYFLKIILFFEAVRREYYHPIRVNFFFAPWIALLFLLLGVPPSVATHLHAVIWYILMTPIFCLELKIYGQWMSGGQRRLSKVANPSNHLSIVGNFVGALLGASMGLKEGPIFFFAVGLAHYTVLFVTLYQRLPTNETLPKELHPVFFLFVAAPSVASMAWAKINGSFDFGSRITYFIALFLYFSLAVRVNFFRGFRFSVAWWAYTFPMTGAAVATIRYSNEVTNAVTRSLSIILSAIATVTVSALLVMTILRAFVFRDLFPNDIAIAISDQKPKMTRKRFHLRHGSSETKHIETYLKCVGSDSKDIEAALNSLNNMDH